MILLNRVICLLLFLLSVGKSDKIPYVSIDDRPSVTHYTGINNVVSAKSALVDGADSIVMTVRTEGDLEQLTQYIELAISAQWQRVVGLGIELRDRTFLHNVTETLFQYGYTEDAPVFLISSDFNVLEQTPFIPVADVSELPVNNITKLMHDLASRQITEVIASQNQIQPYDKEAQQLEYLSELYVQLREAGISIDLCCFSSDPIAPEFHGELINEIRHFLGLGGINALTSKPSVAFTVANEFLLKSKSDSKFEFAVINELPQSQVKMINGGYNMNWKSLMTDLNFADIEFVVQVGSPQQIGQNCTDEFKIFVQGEFDASIHPLFYSPGEDEWKDCNLNSISTQELRKRQNRVKALFALGNASMGQVRLPLLRQSHLSAIMPEFAEYAENIIWEQNDILFIYPAIVDPSTVQRYTTLADYGVVEKDARLLDIQSKYTSFESASQSQKSYDAACAWLEFGFNEAIRRGSAGVVVMWHAKNVFNTNPDTKYDVFEDVLDHLQTLMLRLNKPVLLFHQAATHFKIDKPLISDASGESMELLTRVQITAGQWVRVQTNPDASDINEVFMIKVEEVDKETLLAPVPKKSPDLAAFSRSEDTFSIGVIGGLPQSAPVDSWKYLLQDISQAHVSFVVHTGDIKDPNRNCSDEYYEYILDKLNGIRHPVVYIPGDQEWTNCNYKYAGGWNPHERLDFVRHKFFHKPQMSLGKYPMPLLPQSMVKPNNIIQAIKTKNIGRGLPENSMWVQAGVIFATVHMVGSNNNCERQLQDSDQVYEERLLEFNHRNAANVEFIQNVFDTANFEDAPGVIIFFNGNPFQELQDSQKVEEDDIWGVQIKNGFQKVMGVIRNETLDYGNPVLLVHSDDQQFTVDKPLQIPLLQDVPQILDSEYMSVDNLWRVQLAGAGQVWWLEVIIDPDHPDVFLFEPRLVRTNLIDHTPQTPIWAVDDPDKICKLEYTDSNIYPGQQ